MFAASVPLPLVSVLCAASGFVSCSGQVLVFHRGQFWFLPKIHFLSGLVSLPAVPLLGFVSCSGQVLSFCD
jgi:hypothetical protein